MGERAIENRLRKLKELESQISKLEEQAEAVKAEIKQDMEAKGQEEIKAGNFIVRWKKVITNRFDGKAFAKEHESLYSQYGKQTESRRFSIV